MGKYKVGDQFIATITKIDDTGMGTTYTFNDGMITTDRVIDNLEPYESPSSLPENERKAVKVQEYTIDELRSRIFRLSRLLTQTIDKYEEMKTGIRLAVEIADAELGGE